MQKNKTEDAHYIVDGAHAPAGLLIILGILCPVFSKFLQSPMMVPEELLSPQECHLLRRYCSFTDFQEQLCDQCDTVMTNAWVLLAESANQTSFVMKYRQRNEILELEPAIRDIQDTSLKQGGGV